MKFEPKYALFKDEHTEFGQLGRKLYELPFQRQFLEQIYITALVNQEIWEKVIDNDYKDIPRIMYEIHGLKTRPLVDY